METFMGVFIITALVIALGMIITTIIMTSKRDINTDTDKPPTQQLNKNSNVINNRINQNTQQSSIIYQPQIRPTVFVYPYHRVNLLTNAELRFYYSLKNITAQYGYEILAKIRLADLINVNNGLNSSEWGKYFGKIKAKHIDFAVHKNMNIICLIELDDYTHQRKDRADRDMFVDTVLQQNGYRIIHTHGELNNIINALNQFSSAIRS